MPQLHDFAAGRGHTFGDLVVTHLIMRAGAMVGRSPT